MWSVVSYLYSHKLATDKEELYTAILPTILLLCFDILKLKKLSNYSQAAN